MTKPRGCQLFDILSSFVLRPSTFFRHSCFVLRHSFVIRPSSLVIPSSPSTPSAAEELCEHLFVVLVENHSMIIDGRFEYDFLECRLVVGERLMVAIGDFVWLGEDRRPAFHIEKPHRPAESETQLQGVEQMKHGDIVLAETQ